mgnify:FL=1
MSKSQRVCTWAAFAVLLAAPVLAQSQAQDAMQSAADQAMAIAQIVGAVVLAVVGMIALGRAAYKFSTGDHDAVTSLVTSVVAICLGVAANNF